MRLSTLSRRMRALPAVAFSGQNGYTEAVFPKRAEKSFTVDGETYNDSGRVQEHLIERGQTSYQLVSNLISSPTDGQQETYRGPFVEQLSSGPPHLMGDDWYLDANDEERLEMLGEMSSDTMDEVKRVMADWLWDHGIESAEKE